MQRSYHLIFIVFLLAVPVEALTATTDTSSLSVRFDGYRAFEHLRNQCNLGPRIPGTPPHAAALEYFERELRQQGLQPRRQTFETNTNLLGRVELTNLFILDGSTTRPQLALSAHWDTRPMADEENSPNARAQPFDGANDGASGVAVLLELARLLHLQPPQNHSVLLILVDGEDLGDRDHFDQWCLGSKYFVENLPPGLRILAGINLDMVGDRDLHFQREGYSQELAPELNDEIWALGKNLFPAAFSEKSFRRILDDHHSFLAKKIPFVNLIDFDYPHWHKLSDTPENCSPQSLEITGTVIWEWLKFRDRKEEK
ncbi:MAG: M28 family peptidase [bacterium]